MDKKLKNLRQSYPDQIKTFLVFILILGIIFRFASIEKKLYWEDEVRTSLRTSGYTSTEIVEQVYDGRLIGIDQLYKYKFPNPEKGLSDALEVLMDHPEHPPLYYLLTRFWVQWFGNSVAVVRSLPILISLIAFPLVYWLCLELFGSFLAGWLAIAIIAISPLHVLYAQEARQYSIWTTTILLSSAALLRAIRLKSKTSWGIYAATLIIGLYSHLLFGLVIIAHGIYVLAMEDFRLSKSLLRYGQTALIALLAFAPWIWVIINHSSQIKRAVTAVNKRVSLSHLIDVWFRSINRVFFSADLGSANIIIVIIVLYSIYFICRYSPKRIWLFTVALLGVNSLAIMLPDLVLGGTGSTRLRYLTPCYLVMQLILAYLFASQIAIVKTWRQTMWRMLLIIIISGGVLGCVVDAQKEITWNKGDDNGKRLLLVAKIINQASQPLVISDSSLRPKDPSAIQTLNLSYQLEPKVHLQLVTEPNLPQIPDGFNHIFLFRPSEHLREAIKRTEQFKLEPIIERKTFQFWQLLKRPIN